MLVILVGCEKGPENNTRYCEKTFLVFFGYFDNCYTQKYEWKKGHFYTGEWKNNKFHSKLGITSSKFSTGSGQWIMGKKHGLHFYNLDEATILSNYNMGSLIDTNTRLKNTSSSSTPLYVPNNSSNNASALFNLGGSILNKKSSSSLNDYKAPSRQASYITTVDSNELCPLLSSPLIKQEVRRGQRFCHYQ